MGLLDGMRRRRWRARLARYPRVEADHAAGLAEAMREAVVDLLGRLPAPAAGMWFAGGYRVADLLDRRETLGGAKWYVSSPDEAAVERCAAAVPGSVPLPGSFVERLAGFPEKTLDGVVLLWPTAPPLELLLRVASARLAPGGRVAVVSLRDGTPEPTARSMRRAVRRATKGPVRSRGLGSPASPEDLRGWFRKAGCGDAVCWVDGRNLVFGSGTDARLCLEAISGGAAFPERLSGRELARARAAFDGFLEEECAGAGGAVLSYEFICGLASRVV